MFSLLKTENRCSGFCAGCLRHALAKPAHEVTLTWLGREPRDQSKAFIDAAVFRGGNLLNGRICAALGMAAGVIAPVVTPGAEDVRQKHASRCKFQNVQICPGPDTGFLRHLGVKKFPEQYWILD